MLDSIKINKIIEIEVGHGTDYSGTYRTRVEDIKKNSLVIGMPINQGNYVPLRPGSEVIIWHWANSASYAYYCRVKERTLEPLPLVFLEWPPFEIKKVQRRDFVRVPVNLYLEYKLEHGPELETEVFHKVSIRDLSGGGTQFIAKNKLIKGDTLKIKLFLPNDTINCKAKVMWVYTEIKDNKERLLTGIKFVDIPEKVRDKIIKYVFERQRELIQKGVL